MTCCKLVYLKHEKCSLPKNRASETFYVLKKWWFVIILNIHVQFSIIQFFKYSCNISTIRNFYLVTFIASVLAKQVLNSETAMSLVLSFLHWGPAHHNLTSLSLFLCLSLCLSIAEAFISHRAVLLSLSSAVISALRGPCSYSHTHRWHGTGYSSRLGLNASPHKSLW